MINKDYTGTDILDCLASLSNDEVFTPPKIANKVLDNFPQDVFKNKDFKFLDIASKSGVFLREIAKRLLIGLKNEIPNLEQRKEHIYKNMIYGISITELTSHISRRTLYYSKNANDKFSVLKMPNENGNIYFDKNANHKFNKSGKCEVCGVSQDSIKGTEKHCYDFIHKNIQEIFKNMKFDIIVGNPPYQLNDDGYGASAKPLYNLFVEQAIKLNPKYISLIIPSRWFAGGKGLDKFREQMLNDKRIKKIVDCPNASDCFKGVEIKGGVNYFLWDRDYKDDCEITTIEKGEILDILTRPLNEFDTFVRFNQAIKILYKVLEQEKNSKFLNTQISARQPFGFTSNFKYYQNIEFNNSVKIYGNQFQGFIKQEQVLKNKQWIHKYKVLLPKAGDGSGDYPILVIGKPLLAEPNSCCTETYLVCGAYNTEQEALNLQNYLKTKMVRFLISLIKISHNTSKKVFAFVPNQDFIKSYTDKDLYKKYNLTEEEINYVESRIREMV